MPIAGGASDTGRAMAYRVQRVEAADRDADGDGARQLPVRRQQCEAAGLPRRARCRPRAALCRMLCAAVGCWAAGIECASGTVAHHVAPHLTLDLEQLARLLFLRKSNIAAARCGGMDRHRITWQLAVPPGTV